MIGRLRQLFEVARAIRAGRRLAAHDRWSVEELRAYQRRRLLAIVRHAASNSPYYRERFAGIELSDDLDLAALPRLDKATMLENFDDLVTDRRLTLDGVEAHLAELERADPGVDPKLLRAYRIVASGGSSGRRGVFVYGHEDWNTVLGGAVRLSRGYFGLPPRLPRNRLTTIWAESPLHISGRAARTLDTGISPYRFQRLDVRAPLDSLVEELNAFQPEGLSAYASTAALLAERQLSGDLHISPRVVTTGAEVRSPEMEKRIIAAWGRAPFDFYNASESGGGLAAECDRHAGLHVFEDLAQIEVVDDEYRPVPAGEPGNRLLLTNLFNRTQPLIRYELNDLITLSADACPCGRPFPLLESVDGRSDDLLELPATAGGAISIHPLTLRSPLSGIAALSEYRIVFGKGELRVEAVLNGASDPEQTCREVTARLGEALAKSGAQAPPIRAESVAEIPRHPHSGKQKTIEVQA